MIFAVSRNSDLKISFNNAVEKALGTVNSLVRTRTKAPYLIRACV